MKRSPRVFEEILTTAFLIGVDADQEVLVAADVERADVMVSLALRDSEGERLSLLGHEGHAFLFADEARYLAEMLLRAADALDPRRTMMPDRTTLDITQWPYNPPGGDDRAEQTDESPASR
jgi:hypothetical protein